APFSRDPRRYRFRYAGVEFCWKGTGTVRESRACGFWLRVARVPVDGLGGDGEKEGGFVERREVCLGKYTSSMAAKKYGMLELFDAAIWRLAVEYIRGYAHELPAVEDEKAGCEEELRRGLDTLRSTRLYHVIVGTAVCMIIGEKEKRETLRRILELLASEGGGNA
ncbi:hypothetical protein AOQ84DRAFT_354894, partial [Glonium stellatum]